LNQGEEQLKHLNQATFDLEFAPHKGFSKRHSSGGWNIRRSAPGWINISVKRDSLTAHRTDVHQEKHF